MRISCRGSKLQHAFLIPTTFFLTQNVEYRNPVCWTSHLPNGGHRNKRPPNAFPESFHKWFGKLLWIVNTILQTTISKYLTILSVKALVIWYELFFASFCKGIVKDFSSAFLAYWRFLFQSVWEKDSVLPQNRHKETTLPQPRWVFQPVHRTTWREGAKARLGR